MKDILVAFAFITLVAAAITFISIHNDKNIEKKGGETEYIWQIKKDN